jgi:hypothetical protein
MEGGVSIRERITRGNNIKIVAKALFLDKEEKCYQREGIIPDKSSIVDLSSQERIDKEDGRKGYAEVDIEFVVFIASSV